VIEDDDDDDDDDADAMVDAWEGKARQNAALNSRSGIIAPSIAPRRGTIRRRRTPRRQGGRAATMATMAMIVMIRSGN
jgi:hypothetical protein